MGLKSGDKARYHRQRRKKLARRVAAQAVRKALEAKKVEPAPQ
jgi:hypothetical protein